MRLLSLCFVVALMALVFTLLRDEAGRVGVIVFVTGLVVVGAALGAILTMFTTLGTLGTARTLRACVDALVATALVALFGSSVALLALFAGAYLVRWSVS